MKTKKMTVEEILDSVRNAPTIEKESTFVDAVKKVFSDAADDVKMIGRAIKAWFTPKTFKSHTEVREDKTFITPDNHGIISNFFKTLRRFIVNHDGLSNKSDLAYDKSKQLSAMRKENLADWELSEERKANLEARLASGEEISPRQFQMIKAEIKKIEILTKASEVETSEGFVIWNKAWLTYIEADVASRTMFGSIVYMVYTGNIWKTFMRTIHPKNILSVIGKAFSMVGTILKFVAFNVIFAILPLIVVAPIGAAWYYGMLWAAPLMVATPVGIAISAATLMITIPVIKVFVWALRSHVSTVAEEYGWYSLIYYTDSERKVIADGISRPLTVTA